MKTIDIDLLVDSLGRPAAARRAAAADCADLDRTLAAAIRRRRRTYEIGSTAMPVVLLAAIALLAPAAAKTAHVESNDGRHADAVMADADAVIDAWLANA